MISLLFFGTTLPLSALHSLQEGSSVGETVLQSVQGLFAAPLIALMVTLGIAVYILPSAIAYSRDHQNFVPILVVNLAFGWMFVGWIAAVAWAFSSNVAESRQTIRKIVTHEYQPPEQSGDGRPG